MENADMLDVSQRAFCFLFSFGYVIVFLFLFIFIQCDTILVLKIVARTKKGHAIRSSRRKLGIGLQLFSALLTSASGTLCSLISLAII